MGCDIHLFVEKRTDGAWACVPPPTRETFAWPVDARLHANSPWWGPCNALWSMECDGPGDEGCEGSACVQCMGTGFYLQWWWNRDYLLFGFLAGVRCPEEQYWAPRGLPADVNPTVARLLSSVDYHTHSHIIVAELLRCEAWPDELKGFIDEFVKQLLVTVGPPEDVRIVFAFDN